MNCPLCLHPMAQWEEAALPLPPDWWPEDAEWTAETLGVKHQLCLRCDHHETGAASIHPSVELEQLTLDDINDAIFP